MSTEIKIRSTEEILEFRDKLIDALKNQNTITDTDKQCAQRLVDKIKLLEWVMGSNNPFDEFQNMMIGSKIKNWLSSGNKQSKTYLNKDNMNHNETEL